MNAPPTAALPIAACPNPSCKSECEIWHRYLMTNGHVANFDDEVARSRSRVSCKNQTECFYQGPWADSDEQAIRLHNFICEPQKCLTTTIHPSSIGCATAVQATADADGTVKELAREIHHYLTYVQEPPCDQRFDLEEIIRRVIRKAVSPKAGRESLSAEDRKRINRACWRMVTDCRFAEQEYAQVGIRELPKGKTLSEVLDAWKKEGDAYFRLTQVFSAPPAVSVGEQEKDSE